MNLSVRTGAIVFEDTSVIIEACRSKSWIALAGAYRIETDFREPHASPCLTGKFGTAEHVTLFSPSSSARTHVTCGR